MSTFVKGQTRETAQALLAAADGLGLDRSSIKTVRGGFNVPDEILEALDSIEGIEEATEETPQEKPAAKRKPAAKKKKVGED